MKGKAKLLSPLLLVAMLLSLIGAAVTISVAGNVAAPVALASPAATKSMYLIADHTAGEFEAWEIHPDGTITYQATYNLSVADEPSGIGIDEDTATLFVTSEFGDFIELVDATTFTSLGYAVAPGATNLAGLAVDNATNTVYTIDRATNHLYVYHWNPVSKTLNLTATEDLANCVGAWGIALDDINGILYVADSLGGKIRGYDVDTWAEVKTFTPSQVPVGIAVDAERGFIYTSAPDGTCAPIGGTPHPGTDLLVKTVIATGVETSVNMVTGGGMGVAVDEATGYVYVTLGCSGDTVQVWDTSTTLWTKIQETGDIGNPAGICIPVAVAYNPLCLHKDDGYVECVNRGANINYTICYNNTRNDFAVHNVVITDNLSANVSFVSATGDGVYDADDHAVVWDIGTVEAGAATVHLYLVVKVNTTAPVNSTIDDECTIDGDETGPSTVYVETLVCEAVVPLGLEKADNVEDCVWPGENINYQICYDNLGNAIDVHNVTLTDILSNQVDFVSATGGGVYNAGTRTVTWNLGTVLAGAEQECVGLVVKVHSDTTAFYITNYCTISGSEEGTSNEASVTTDVCTECDRGIIQADITVVDSSAVKTDVNGWIEGVYIDTRFVGDYHGEGFGEWDCYIDGHFDGYVEGYFDGWTSQWGDYTGDYYGYIDGYIRGHFEGWHYGEFCGFVDGSFSGYKSGYFDGIMFGPPTVCHSVDSWLNDYYDAVYFNGYYDGGTYIGRIWDCSYYSYTNYYGGQSYGDWYGHIDGYFQGYVEGYFSGSYIPDGYSWCSGYSYDGWWNYGYIDGYLQGDFYGYHDGYFDGYVDGAFGGYKYGYFSGDMCYWDPSFMVVTAKIYNIGQVDVPSVWASIDIDGPACLAYGEDVAKYVGTVTTDWPPPAEPYGYQEVSWVVQCEGPGEVNITVTPWAVPPAGVCAYSDTVTICQPDLAIDIVEYPLCSVNPCQTFSIKAEIYNLNDYATAKDVDASISISDPELASLIQGEPEDKYLGDIGPGESQQVSWTLHCDNPGDVIITVNAEATVDVYSHETCQACSIVGEKAACVAPASVYVRQNCPAALDVVVDAKDKVCECTEYEVTATITNTGDRDAVGVNATIDLPEGVELAEGENATKQVGCDGLIPRGHDAEVSWTVHCNTTGTARITVVAEGKDALTADPISDHSVVSVEQFDDFFVLITKPDDGDTFSSGQNFTVRAKVCNCNETVDLENVNVTISWPAGSPFELVEGNSTETIDIDSSSCECVCWKVQCTGAGTRTITVTATCNDPERWDQDAISVNQQTAAHLVATIYFPDDGDYFATCQEFHLKASVTNTGQATAEDVTVAIGTGVKETGVDVGLGDNETTEFELCDLCHFETLLPDTVVVYLNGTKTTHYTLSYEKWGVVTITFDTAPEEGAVITADYMYADSCNLGDAFELVDPECCVQHLGDIPGGVEVPVMWTLHCTNPGDVIITLVPSGKDANMGGWHHHSSGKISEENIEPAYVAIDQYGLDVEITDAPCDVDFCDTYFVNVEVTNWGDETIPDVVATITIDGYAELVGAQYATKALGDVRPGETHDVSWTLHCYGPGETFIMVTASVTDTDAELSDWVWVDQHKDQGLAVLIESPADDTHFLTQQEFMVTAKLYNMGEATLTNVTATISVPDYDWDWVEGIPAPFNVLSDATVEVGSIAPAEYKFVTWTLKGRWADGSTWAEIAVCGVGYDIDTGEEISGYSDIDAYIYPAAHLVVNITAPEDGLVIQTGSDFYLTATVTNDGFADAWDVSLNIEFDPCDSVQLLAGSPTVQVGNLAGHTQNGSATVTWHLYCKQVCSTTIHVYAEGIDEYWYSGYDDYYWYYGEFWQSDTITVKQVDSYLCVELSYPDEVYAGREFAVTAVVRNHGSTAALGVSATISVAGPASIEGAATQTIGTIGPDSSATVSWTLKCKDEGGVSIAVSASGTNTNVASDSGAVQQVKTPPGCCGVFWGLIGGAIILGIFICVAYWIWRRKA
jgi:uncharacterized repeat protein (TIGR01451 family)